jgi:hypothetical protein
MQGVMISQVFHPKNIMDTSTEDNACVQVYGSNIFDLINISIRFVVEKSYIIGRREGTTDRRGFPPLCVSSQGDQGGEFM